MQICNGEEPRDLINSLQTSLRSNDVSNYLDKVCISCRNKTLASLLETLKEDRIRPSPNFSTVFPGTFATRSLRIQVICRKVTYVPKRGPISREKEITGAPTLGSLPLPAIIPLLPEPFWPQVFPFPLFPLSYFAPDAIRHLLRFNDSDISADCCSNRLSRVARTNEASRGNETPRGAIVSFSDGPQWVLSTGRTERTFLLEIYLPCPRASIRPADGEIIGLSTRKLSQIHYPVIIKN